jgi:hypothetical protein
MTEDFTRRGLLFGSAALIGTAVAGSIASRADAAAPGLTTPSILPASVSYDLGYIRPGITGITYTGIPNGEAVWDDTQLWASSPGVYKEGQKHYQAYMIGDVHSSVTWYWKSDLYVHTGMSGVKVIQKQLNVARTSLSGAGLTVDGVWGSATTSAVKRFQGWVNTYKLRPTGSKLLTVDGVVGPATWSWLKL